MKHTKWVRRLLCLVGLIAALAHPREAETNEDTSNKRELNRSIQRLIALIGDGENTLTSVEAVEAAMLLRREARGASLSEAEKEWKWLIEDLIAKKLDVRLYRLTLSQIGFTGYIEVKSVPPGATIFLDGAQTGFITPHTFSVPVGKHVVEVRLPAQRQSASAITVDVSANETARAAFTLTPAGHGTLLIGSRPFGAQIFLDGEQRGNTPLKLKEVIAGTHFVRLVKGNVEYTEMVEVEPDTITKVVRQFEKQ